MENESRKVIDFAIFAHNEERSIAAFLSDLDQQSLFRNNDARCRIRVLCNGCTDNTELVARKAVNESTYLSSVTFVDHLKSGGKSRTWNHFVSALPQDSIITVFIDGDIRIPDKDTLEKLISELADSAIVAATSHPIKDLRSLRSNTLLRIAASQIVREHKDGSIAGSLYAVKSESIRSIRLPVPCLVEDGFLAACLKTKLFSIAGEPELIRATKGVRHYFEPPTKLSEFFEHDVRLCLGVWMNAALYAELWACPSVDARITLLDRFSKSLAIDEALDKHSNRVSRETWHFRNLLSCIWPSRRERIFSKILRLPLRLAHWCYLANVRLRSRHLFRSRQFKW